MRGVLRLTILIVACLQLWGCSFQSTARRWHGRTDPDGEPAYYKAITKIGINLFIFIPFVGDMSIDGLVEDLMEFIEEEEGKRVRLVQGSTENYWYGYPPFTWVLSPVISTVSAEYEPSAAELAKQKELEDTGKVGPRWYMPWTW